jgi:hypothetical protein
MIVLGDAPISSLSLLQSKPIQRSGTVHDEAFAENSGEFEQLSCSVGSRTTNKRVSSSNDLQSIEKDDKKKTRTPKAEVRPSLRGASKTPTRLSSARKRLQGSRSNDKDHESSTLAGVTVRDKPTSIITPPRRGSKRTKLATPAGPSSPKPTTQSPKSSRRWKKGEKSSGVLFIPKKGKMTSPRQTTKLLSPGKHGAAHSRPRTSFNAGYINRYR